MAFLHGFELRRAPAGRRGRVRGNEGVCGCGADAAKHAEGGEALEQQQGAPGLEEPAPGLDGLPAREAEYSLADPGAATSTSLPLRRVASTSTPRGTTSTSLQVHLYEYATSTLRVLYEYEYSTSTSTLREYSLRVLYEYSTTTIRLARACGTEVSCVRSVPACHGIARPGSSSGASWARARTRGSSASVSWCRGGIHEDRGRFVAKACR